MFEDDETPFYDMDEELNVDSFINNKYDEEVDNKIKLDTCECGGEYTKIITDGRIQQLCKNCGAEVEINENAEYITQSKKSITTAGSAPAVHYTKCGTTTYKRTHYSINNKEAYRKRVKKEIIDDIMKRSYNTGIDLNIAVAVKAADIFIKIREQGIHRANIKSGIVAACIMNAYKSCGHDYSRNDIIKLMGIEDKYVSQGEKVFTRCMRPFNIDDWLKKCRIKIKGLLNKFGIFTKPRLLFVCNIVKFCERMYIGIHSSDESKCAGAVWFLIELEGLKIDIKDFIKDISHTKNTIMRFVDDLKIMIWRIPMPNTIKFPDRFERTQRRRDQLRYIITSAGFKLPVLYNQGRFKKYFHKYNIETQKKNT